jgi:hypothetical protein
MLRKKRTGGINDVGSGLRGSFGGTTGQEGISGF